jgi:hypothetical protein
MYIKILVIKNKIQKVGMSDRKKYTNIKRLQRIEVR